MPTRKSKKHNNHHPMTSQEQSIHLSQGTLTTRLGKDSQLPFGTCPLSLQAASDPVVTPGGGLYEREAIVSYLVRENEKLAEWRGRWEAQQAGRVREHLDEVGKTEGGKVEAFRATNSGGVITDVEGAVKEHRAKRDGEFSAQGFNVKDKGENLKDLKRSSFWLSDFAPEATADRVTEPPRRPNSPFSGRALRLKDLKSVSLVRDSDEDATSRSFLCAVSRKRLTTQEVVAITRTGSVMLASSYEEFARGDMVDPVKGGKFKEKDVVRLRKAASGYSASGKVEAKTYTATMT
jgi:nitric oxide synthase-interacting protein